MSANQQLEGDGSRIVFILETRPHLHLKEMENLHRLAAQRGQSVAELLASLAREELAAAAAGLPAGPAAA